MSGETSTCVIPPFGIHHAIMARKRHDCLLEKHRRTEKGKVVDGLPNRQVGINASNGCKITNLGDVKWLLLRTDPQAKGLKTYNAQFVLELTIARPEIKGI